MDVTAKTSGGKDYMDMDASGKIYLAVDGGSDFYVCTADATTCNAALSLVWIILLVLLLLVPLLSTVPKQLN